MRNQGRVHKEKAHSQNRKGYSPLNSSCYFIFSKDLKILLQKDPGHEAVKHFPKSLPQLLYNIESFCCKGSIFPDAISDLSDKLSV